MRQNLALKLILIMVITALLSLGLAIPLVTQQHEEWEEQHFYSMLSAQTTAFQNYLEQYCERSFEHLSVFAKRRQTSRAIQSGDRDRVLTLATSEAVALAADAFFVVPADESWMVDPIGMTSVGSDPQFDDYIVLALSYQSHKALYYHHELGIGVVISLLIDDVAGAPVGAVMAFLPLTGEWLAKIKALSGYDYTVATQDGRVMASTLAAAEQRLPLPHENAGEQGTQVVKIGRSSYITLQSPLRNSEGIPIARLMISGSIDGLRAAQANMTRTTGMIAVGAFLISIVLALCLLPRISPALTTMTRSAAQIAEGDFDVDLDIQSNDELGTLAAAINKMARDLKSATAARENAQKSLKLAKDQAESNATQLAHHRDHLQETVDLATAGLEAQAKELKKALAKEQEFNALQREFVSMASHEFRTPLAIIDMTAQRMRSRADKDQLTPKDAVQKVDEIRAAVQRMTQLMESTLAAARMQEGKIKLNIQHCDIGKVVREVCARQQEIAQTHVISCDLVDLPKTIQADASLLEKMFTNLLSNAVKYAPDARDIEVTGRREGHQVVISVCDHGLGIDEDELDRIGERFFRARTSTGLAGTGIGLNLGKSLVEMHGGSVSVESKKGEGSTFTVRLPIDGPERPRNRTAKLLNERTEQATREKDSDYQPLR